MAEKKVSQTAPDIKRPYDATIPSLPLAAAIFPILLYVWILYGATMIGINFFEVQMMKRDYPGHVAEKQQLDTRIAEYNKVLEAADAQFALFKLWKGWLLEAPPMAQLTSQILSAIQSDVRITTLQLSKQKDVPNQLDFELKLALTKTDPSRQFDMVLQGLDKLGWRVGGSVNQSVDLDSQQKFPTEAGAPREVFYQLESELNERIDANNPNVPFGPVPTPTPEVPVVPTI